MVCRVVCLKAFLGSKHPAEDKVKEILFVTKWLPFSSPIVCSIVVWKIAICDKIKVIRRENLKKGNFKNKQYYIDFRKCLISSCTSALWYDMLLHYFSNFRALYQLVLERTPKYRTSNTSNIKTTNFEHIEHDTQILRPNIEQARPNIEL